MPTLAQLESLLVGPAPDAGAGLVGGLLAGVGFSATGESPVAALGPAISAGLAACDITPDDPIAPDNEDLGRLAAADWQKFLDITCLLLLEQASFGFIGRVKVLQFKDYRKENFGAADLTALLNVRREAVLRRWGYGASRMFPGSIRIESNADCSEF